MQIPASQISAINPGGGLLIQGAAFDTFVSDASVPPVFAKAVLAVGTVNGTMAMINLASPLAQKNAFIGQDNDFSPFYFPLPRALGAVVQRGIERGLIQNLFIALQIPKTRRFLGLSGTPPLIGLDGPGAGDGLPDDAPILGQSFSSMDGGRTWTQVPNFNFRFSLIVSRPPDQP